MKIGKQKTVELEAKTLVISAKCSDCCPCKPGEYYPRRYCLETLIGHEGQRWSRRSA